MSKLGNFKNIYHVIVLIGVLLSLCIAPTLAQAVPPKQEHLQALTDRWIAQHPEKAEALEKAKKDAEKLEKNFKDYSDKAFQNSFDTVFGKDKLKPSSAIDYLKVFEAVTAGDIEEAGKLSTDLLIAAYAPGLGHYITAMKFVHEKIDKQVTSWGDEVYQTDTFKFFRRDLARMTKLDPMEARNLQYPSYIPSYMLQKFRSDPYMGKDMDVLYKEMVKFESELFKHWSEGDEPREFALQFGDLKKKSWWDFGSTGGKNSQWIVALGADPSSFGKLSVERKMFNFFLYELTSAPAAREGYMYELSLFYIEPWIKREARREQKRFDAAIAQALGATIAAIAEEEKKQAGQDKIDAEAKAKAAAQALEAKYRKYITDGQVNGTVDLPMGVTVDAAFRIGMKAVEYNKKGFYAAIDDLTALARKQANEREQAAIAREEEAAKQQAVADEKADADALKAAVVSKGDQGNQGENVGGVGGQTAPLPVTKHPPVQPLAQLSTQPNVSPSLRRCLTNYDFSKHENADTLVLLPEYLEADKKGYLNDAAGRRNINFLVNLAGNVCNSNATPQEDVATGEDDDDYDEWGDVDAVDDLIVSSLSEDEKWELRDNLAAQSERDAQRSESKIKDQYASAQAWRAEQARIAAEKAAKRRAFMAELAEGLNQVAIQIQEAQQPSTTSVVPSSLGSYNPPPINNASSGYIDTRACETRLMTKKDFPIRDPYMARMQCMEEVTGKSKSSDSIAGRLRIQTQERTKRAALDERKRIASQNAAIEKKKNANRAAMERKRAKAQCKCYQQGKSYAVARKNDSVPSGYRRPSNCPVPHMSATTPYSAGGLELAYQSHTNKTAQGQRLARDLQKQIANWCRFGS